MADDLFFVFAFFSIKYRMGLGEPIL